MLRHKRIINFSFYYYKKSLRLPDERSFHVTYSSCLRSLPSSRKRYSRINSPSEEAAVAGNFVAQPLKSVFNNFYGIESDEGVILVDDKPASMKSPQDSFINKSLKKKLPEKVKKTSFGKVRLDNENKLILHGQYEESTLLDTENIIRATRLTKIAIKDSEANDDPLIEEAQVSRNESQNLNLCHAEDIKYQEEVDVKRSVMDVGKIENFEKANNISFVDELYFPDKLLENPKNESSVLEKPLVNEKDASSIDKGYFSNEPMKENIDKAINFTIENSHSELDYDKYKNGSLHKKSELSEEKFGYIDESFFNSTQESMNSEKNLKLMSEIDFNPELKNNNSQTKSISSINKGENISFIDECFFNEDHESKMVGKSAHHSIENLSLPEIPICHNNVKKNEVYNANKPVYKLNSELNVKNMECKEDENSNYNIGIKSLDTLEEETLYYNSSELNQYNDNFTKVVSSAKNTNFAYKEAIKESLNSKINPKTISSTKEYPNAKKLDQITLKHDNISERVNDLSGNVRNNEKKSQEDEPKTAFDFVKKLRGDQKSTVTYHESISGFSSAPKEKFDSKGMRILKYQVPQLKYFTRDEMLELLLKNVLYSDDDVVVLNKPYNLVMHDSKTTKDACLSQYLDDFAGMLDKNSKNSKLLTVHRLDKETTGCLLLARNEVSAQNLKSLFAQRKIVKTYWIVTIRVPDPVTGIIDIPITEGFIESRARMVLHPDLPKDIAYRNHSRRGKNAVTHYSVIAQSGSAALVEVKPETGIKHQIRVHFGLGLACPILGDHKYSYPDKFVPQKLSNDMLHNLQVRQSKVRHIPMHIYARSIFIPQYTTGRNLFVMAPMPAHMSKNLQRLKFRKK